MFWCCSMYYLCCSMYYLCCSLYFCVVLHIVCFVASSVLFLPMCTALLRPGGYPIAINHIISYHISYHIIYHIITYHIIYHIMSCHIISSIGILVCLTWNWRHYSYSKRRNCLPKDNKTHQRGTECWASLVWEFQISHENCYYERHPIFSGDTYGGVMWFSLFKIVLGILQF
jgi:hypothetical protein